MLRRAALALLVCAAVAHADKRTDELAAGYQKEATACGVQAGGIAKVVDGAQKLRDAGEDVAADLDALGKGKATVDAYCAELAAALDALRPSPRYKDVERDLDERDNRIRKLRKDAKAAIAALEPIIHRLVPRINTRATAPDAAKPRAVPHKFPSGRAVELPALGGGAWTLSGTAETDTADYADKAFAATLFTRAFGGATCAQQKRMLPKGADEDALAGEGVEWRAHYTRPGSPARYVVVLCTAKDATSGWISQLELRPAEPKAHLDELSSLLIRMLIARRS